MTGIFRKRNYGIYRRRKPRLSFISKKTIFYENFETGTLDSGKWDCIGANVTVQSTIKHGGIYAMKMQSGDGDPTISSITLNKDGKLTFDFYFYVASGGTTYECPLLQLFFGSDKAQYSDLGDVKKSSGTVKIGYYNSSFSFVQLSTITADAWHHLVIVADVPNQTVSWTLNGTVVGTYDHIDQNTGNAIAATARMNDFLLGAGTGSYPNLYIDDIIISQEGGTQLNIDANLDFQLSGLQISSTATVDITGSLSKTLGNLGSSATAAVEIKAALSKILESVEISSSVVSAITGSLDKSFSSISSESTATVQVNASLSKSLADVSLTSSGVIAIAGVLSKNLASLVLTASATIEIKATASKTLDSLGLAATGETATGAIIGSASILLGPLAASASAVSAISALATASLSGLQVAATGKIAVVANAETSLGTLICVGVCVINITKRVHLLDSEMTSQIIIQGNISDDNHLVELESII